MRPRLRRGWKNMSRWRLRINSRSVPGRLSRRNTCPTTRQPFTDSMWLPKTETARTQLAAEIGADGKKLLQAIEGSDARAELIKLESVILLRRVWEEQFVEADGKLRFREVKEMPSPATLITSPYDSEARYSTKRGQSWVGYKVHFTESCDDDAPRLITNIETTPATTPDDNMIEVVHPVTEETRSASFLSHGRQGIHRRQGAGCQ